MSGMLGLSKLNFVTVVPVSKSSGGKKLAINSGGQNNLGEFSDSSPGPESPNTPLSIANKEMAERRQKERKQIFVVSHPVANFGNQNKGCGRPASCPPSFSDS
jgi:hypothetical protein